jgi:peptidyl-prolyl cis-trans isomerase B (cyclophilin B)
MNQGANMSNKIILNRLHLSLAAATFAISATLSIAQTNAPAAKAAPAAKPVPAKDAKPASNKTKASNSCKSTDKGMPVKVKLTTSMGAITVELDKVKAPISVENFVKYVESGHYNGTVFHRVIGSFMIQGGGFDKNYKQKPTDAPIKNESTNGLKNDNYTLAMARTGVRDSATSQFFINVSDKNGFLNYSGENPQGWGYAVFGKVVEGMDIVEKIKGVPTARTQVSEGQPIEPIVIEKAECL